jgi:ferredoxin--NADP+ reductase
VLAEGGTVVGLEVEETRLERKGDRVAAVGTGEISVVPCDTVVFAVGDRVDPAAGLPYADGLYVTRPGEDPSYQVWDPAVARPLEGVYVVGWARRASDGVVGRARLDAETGVKQILAHVAERPPRPAGEAERVLGGVADLLKTRSTAVVPYTDVVRIEAAERARAAAAGVEELKFATNREMLDVVRGS